MSQLLKRWIARPSLTAAVLCLWFLLNILVFHWLQLRDMYAYFKWNIILNSLYSYLIRKNDTLLIKWHYCKTTDKNQFSLSYSQLTLLWDVKWTSCLVRDRHKPFISHLIKKMNWEYKGDWSGSWLCVKHTFSVYSKSKKGLSNNAIMSIIFFQS